MIDTPNASRGILHVYAHPDDESFGNPGTISLYASRGAPVSLVCLTHGEAGETNGICKPEELGSVRAGELRKAAGILGISRLDLWDYPDGGLGDVDNEEAIARLIEAYELISPEVVVTFADDGITGHPDHLVVSKWATEAFTRLSDKSERGPSRLYWRIVPEKRRTITNRPDIIYRDDYTTIIDARDHERTRAEAEACHATQRAHTNYADPALIEMGVVDYYIRKFPKWEGGPYEANLLGGKTHPKESIFP
ncbi:MAG: PIG-L family deacetylase [Nitrospinaceae bacterium]|jgi:LmbE family N-acetylglucosaminyl deacetylase|nr:PIG-L family deacetylase [Nitrospinaceae bacterium]MBT3434175.1 PIG-L family deacetylase [Nitrospinaceae bacterium]MBT3821006.1 PIG-L family deacetylase [Nitrospinaceae bacterium]MBT4094066.1 PIG-L family deacetylase [Nitrospinaceae bacterium]MBT4432104.1 PIG-L family deacetylase [Nitrospinaceae bacterium]